MSVNERIESVLFKNLEFIGRKHFGIVYFGFVNGLHRNRTFFNLVNAVYERNGITVRNVEFARINLEIAVCNVIGGERNGFTACGGNRTHLFAYDRFSVDQCHKAVFNQNVDVARYKWRCIVYLGFVCWLNLYRAFCDRKSAYLCGYIVIVRDVYVVVVVDKYTAVNDGVR